MTLQQQVATAARGWLGTRFHHQGRLKRTANHRGGVDCLGLLVGVADELKLVSRQGEPLTRYDELHYSHSPDPVRLRNTLSRLLREVPLEGMAEGDVLLLEIDGSPQHLGIVSDMGGMPGLIHTYAPARAVVEHLLDDWWKHRMVMAFRIPS